MKKMITIAAVLTLAAGVLTGCGAGPSSTGKTAEGEKTER